jgi:type VI secretion system protein ImpF
MNRTIEDEPLRASVLDRLGGPDGANRASSRQTLPQLIGSVKRDLERLLNTRYRVTAWPPSLEELGRSLVNYGVPDFSGINMSSATDEDHFCRLVEEAIRTHEPRFIKVRVQLRAKRDRLDRTLHFQIDALLRASPEPAEVRFDSSVDPQSHRIQVQPAR